MLKQSSPKDKMLLYSATNYSTINAELFLCSSEIIIEFLKVRAARYSPKLINNKDEIEIQII